MFNLGSEEWCYQYQSILEDSSDEDGDNVPTNNSAGANVSGINTSDTAKNTRRKRKLIKNKVFM